MHLCPMEILAVLAALPALRLLTARLRARIARR